MGEGPDKVAVFNSVLGWMAAVGRENVLRLLTIGHQSAGAALYYVARRWPGDALRGDWNEGLAERLAAYAEGEPDDFLDVELDLQGLTRFRQKVVRCCRRIPWGSTVTYGQLAAKAGSPRAARAVGSAMAANRFVLIVPCHRVVPSHGGLGGYSAAEGITMKQRLLDLEGAETT